MIIIIFFFFHKEERLLVSIGINLDHTVSACVLPFQRQAQVYFNSGLILLILRIFLYKKLDPF